MSMSISISISIITITIIIIIIIVIKGDFLLTSTSENIIQTLHGAGLRRVTVYSVGPVWRG